MGRLYVVSAPSGAGKTTLCNMLLKSAENLVYSVSYTTRQPRPGETNGCDYNFVSKDRFVEMVENKDFLEWAEVFGRYYGTGRAWVEEQLEKDLDVLVDVDISGARQIKSNFPDAVYIFIVPPTLEELGRRLKARGTDTDEQLKERLGRVREEVEAGSIYDYLVVNDDLEKAFDDLASILKTDRLRFSRSSEFWPGFFGEGR